MVHATLWSTRYTHARNFDIDVDVDGACVAAGDHNFSGTCPTFAPILLPVIGVLGWRVALIDDRWRET